MQPSDASGPTGATSDTSSGNNRSKQALANIVANLRKLLLGKLTAALLQLGATVLMARALTPTEFGLVILLHSYVLVCGELFNCKPFEAIIRYGVPAQEAGDDSQVLRLLKLGYVVDVVTSLAATALAIASVGIAKSYLSWDETFAGYAMIYSLVLLAGMTGTSKGILRLYNRFDVLATQLTIAPFILCIGSGFAWFYARDMQAFILIWALATLCERVYLVVSGLRELRRNIPGWRLINAPLQGWQQSFPDIARFTHVVYWQGNLDLVPKHVSNLLVGALLGPAAAGLFRLAKGVSKILSTPAVTIRQVLFPDLTRIWNQADSGFHWILIKTTSAAGACGLVIVGVVSVYGATLLNLLAGSDYVEAASVMTWLLFAATLDMCSSILRAAAYAMGAAGKALRLSVITMLVYITAFIAIGEHLGLAGPGVATTLASLLTLSGMVWLVTKSAKLPRLPASAGGY